MNLLEMHNIHKSFAGVPVLKGVDLAVKKGEIHALLGENGAGKSTLMNVLAGVFPMDSGSVTFNDIPLKDSTIRSTEHLGIAFVHQELNLFNDLRVYENLFFTKEKTTRFGALKKKEMIAESKRLFERLGVEIDASALVGDLKASDKQTLEIAKSIFFDAKLLILDEPTTALSNEEIRNLFDILNNLKSQGKSFIFISHKMPEIFEIADKYTVLRNGEFIGTGEIKDISAEEITKMMVGDTLSSKEIYASRELGDPILELENYSGPGFKNVNLTVRKGEILGLTGLQGAGSSELLQTIFGVTKNSGGAVKLHGQEVKGTNIHRAMKAKVAFLPADRKENSVIADMSLIENMYISEHCLSGKRQHIFRTKEVAKYRNFSSVLSIKANSHNDFVTSLSGGNQQKVFFARWLNTKADILLLDNPTQGIDVGAKAEIYKLILALADEGKTIIFNTLEIPEIQKVADNCAVFYNGELVQTLPHRDIDEHTVMMYATNAIAAGEDAGVC